MKTAAGEDRRPAERRGGGHVHCAPSPVDAVCRVARGRCRGGCRTRAGPAGGL